MNKQKILVVTIMLLVTAAAAFIIPKVKHERSVSLSSLVQVPVRTERWVGKNISSSLDINLEEARFGFISDALAYRYVNSYGTNLVFIVLDAGNFHHPKNCFVSSGYEITELPDTEFVLPNGNVKAHTLLTKRKGISTLSFYWIVIDKNLTHQWVQQKLKQLFFSVFNKRSIGLMVRIDIPINENNSEDALVLARQFMFDLSQTVPSETSDYIFGIL